MSAVASAAEKASKSDKEEWSALAEEKSELDSLFTEVKRPLLVVIDDIDRLSQQEIQEIFRLVKANADFPNVLYLLLFDQDVVAAALNPISGERGKEFLEKIVQVSIDVPVAPNDAIKRMMLEGIVAVLGEEALEADCWKGRDWELLQRDVLDWFVTTPRDAKRLMSSYGFSVSLLSSRNQVEVNPADLLALECFRLFEPAVYRRLPHFRRELTRDNEGPMYREIKWEKVKNILDEIVSCAPEARRPMLLNALRALFPTHGAHSQISSANQFVEFSRDRRLCSVNYFSRYFELSVDADSVSEADISDILSQVVSTDDKLAIAQRLHETGKLRNAFARVTDRPSAIAALPLKDWMVFVLQVHALLHLEESKDIFLSDDSILIQCLNPFRERGEDTTREVLAAIKEVNQIGGSQVVIDYILAMITRHNWQPVSESLMNELKAEHIRQVRESLEQGNFWELPYRKATWLQSWGEWDSYDAVKAAVMRSFKSAGVAANALHTFCSVQYPEKIESLHTEFLAKFVDIPQLRSLLTGFKPAAADEKVVEQFHKFFPLEPSVTEAETVSDE